MTFIDHYKILNVNNLADNKTIRKSYHKLCLQWHPDKNKSDIATERFKTIQASYEILSDQSDPRSAVEVEMLLGQVLSDAGRSDEAAQHYLDALSIAEANDFRMMQGEILSRLGEVESNRSQRMDYLQRSLVVFRELGAVDRMRDVQNSVHRVVMGH